MGSRLAKPVPLDRPIAPGKVQNTGLARPFPVLTPQSYIPGSTGLPPGFLQTGGGPGGFPGLNRTAFPPPPTGLEPPILNFGGGPGMLPPPTPYPPMLQSGISPGFSLPPPMQYPNPSIMSMGPPPYYDPSLRSFSRHRPVRVCRRRRRRGRRSRPVVHIIDSSSCSSLSSCSSISSCSRRRHHRSRSYSRRRAAPQQQQQPIILLPIQCQQPASAPAQNSIQQQPQQIFLPPIQVQQPGQAQSQQLALPPIPFQQQSLGLPQIQLNSSKLLPSTNSSPLIISNGQSFLQPSISLPQFSGIGQPQQIHSGAIQYVQAGRQSSSSPLQYISAEPRSTIAPHRGLVNSSNKKQSMTSKTAQRITSTRQVPQNDLKFGRRPFDWYESEKKNHIIDENIRIGQRGSTTVT